MPDRSDPNIQEALHTYRVSFAIAGWSAVAAWMGLIFFISQNSSPENIGSASKFLDLFPRWSIQWIFHGTAFGMLTVLTYLAVSSTFTWRWPVVVGAAFGVAMAYRALDEVHQSFVSGRSASSYDIGRDAIGGLAAVLLTRAAVVSTDHFFHGRWVESGRMFFSVAMVLEAAFVAWVVSMWIAAGSVSSGAVHWGGGVVGRWQVPQPLRAAEAVSRPDVMHRSGVCHARGRLRPGRDI
jgi:VanZ family protein